jgi:methyl-accepting chemotaxis protein
MRARQSRRRGTTILRQVLFIALVPSVAVLIVGGALSTYLVHQGLQVSGFADDVRGALDPISRFVVGTQEERRLTMLRATSGPSGQAELEAQRRKVDDATAGMMSTAERLAGGASDDLKARLTFLTESVHGLPATRQQIDSGVMDSWQAYHYYNGLLDQCGAVIQGIARSALDAAVGFEQMIAYDLFKSSEAMARSHAMAVCAVAVGLDGTQFHELAHQLGMYHEQVESVVPRLTQQEKDSYAALKETPAWKTLVAGDNALMFRGPSAAKATFDVPTWESSSRQIAEGLTGLYLSHSRYAASLATERGNDTFVASMLAGAGILVIALLAILIALRLSKRMVRRLRSLRQEALDIAHRRLPTMVSTIQSGGQVDLEEQVARLDYGRDEVGQVADAFNIAHRTAVTAAVREAETREGVRSVFLNIARRSQGIVHRQLKVLDAAERAADDPDQLRVLFQLDHLATRSRRNAENLIILAGEQPGRQWRHPIPLHDVVRSAIAETEQYTRINATGLPDVAIVGAAVADLVHLLAELIDNGAAFSSADSRVDVRGSLVSKGLVVEVEDQGLGIERSQREQLNDMLHHPPDFNMMAIGEESRVGLFVVARLAARHGIKVTLRESDFGGERAIVLVPVSRIVITEATRDDPGPRVPRPAAPSEPRTVVGQGKPPLPRRARQADLSPHLMTDTAAWTEVTPIGEEDSLRRSQRARKTMSAFQQGTRQGRDSGRGEMEAGDSGQGHDGGFGRY